VFLFSLFGYQFSTSPTPNIFSKKKKEKKNPQNKPREKQKNKQNKKGMKHREEKEEQAKLRLCGVLFSGGGLKSQG
jgi:hypothetical protein